MTSDETLHDQWWPHSLRVGKMVSCIWRDELVAQMYWGKIMIFVVDKLILLFRYENIMIAISLIFLQWTHIHLPYSLNKLWVLACEEWKATPGCIYTIQDYSIAWYKGICQYLLHTVLIYDTVYWTARTTIPLNWNLSKVTTRGESVGGLILFAFTPSHIHWNWVWISMSVYWFHHSLLIV